MKKLPTGLTGIWKTSTGHFILITATINKKRVYRERLVAGDLRQALKIQTEMRQELAEEILRRQITADGQDTFEAFSKAWLTHLQTSETKHSTIEHYKENLKSHISPYWSRFKINEIKPKSVSDWLDYLSKHKSHYAQKSLHGAWRVFCACIRWICVQSNLPAPVDNIRFNVKAKEEKPKATLSPDELKRAISSVSVIPEPYRTATLLAATTGARIGEITALRWSEIDLNNNTILICRSNTRGKISNTTKTKNQRTVPLAPVAKERLIDLKAEGLGADGGLIFKSARGTPLSAGNFRRHMAAVASEAKIQKRLTPHVFRRAMNDLLRQTSGGAVVARAILGHLSPSMTQHYSTVGHQEALEALGQVLGRP